MNIRDLKRYFACLLLAGAGCVMASCEREEGPSDEPQQQGNPIEIAASAEWPDMDKPGTKALINGVGDLKDDGFVVWANWTKDPADNSHFTGNYESGTNNKVFGLNGTKVYAIDGDNNGVFNPIFQGGGNQGNNNVDQWKYSPKQYWHRGRYTFAALLPASICNAQNAMNGDGSGKIVTGAIDDKTLSLQFTGFNLSTEQKDLMLAFSEEKAETDAQAGTKGSVNLNFKHVLSLIKFQASATDPTIDIESIELTAYKNKATSVEFALQDDKSIDQSWTFDNASTGSTHNNSGSGWNLSTDSQELFELLVFPQEVTGAVATITYIEHFDGEETETEQNVRKTVPLNIPAITWQPSRIYIYKFTITGEGIKLDTPIVKDWVPDNSTFPQPVM